jgi:hydrogenase nickel incorporation protein HypA/HybF
VHELGIATSILERVKNASVEHPGAAIQKVGLRVGELSGVDPDALAFSWEALVKDTPWEPVALEIDFRRRVQRCRQCAHEFATDAFLTECPKCSSLHTETISGDELDIVFLELEEAPCR